MSAKYLKRYEAVFLVQHPKGPKLTYAAAAASLKKSQAFVKKWVKRYLEVRNVDDLPERGLARVTTEKQDKAIVRLFEANPNLTLRQAQVKLRQKGIEVGTNTIRRRLREKSMLFRSTLKKPLLSEKHTSKRLAWAQENLDWNWDNVIFTDESSFWAWSPLSKAWSTKRERVLQRTVKHPVKVHVWGCFSKRGFGCLYLFTDNLNAKKMRQIYRKYLMRSAKKFFGADETNWVLQEDNDPKHRSRLCTVWNRKMGSLRWIGLHRLQMQIQSKMFGRTSRWNSEESEYLLWNSCRRELGRYGALCPENMQKISSKVWKKSAKP